MRVLYLSLLWLHVTAAAVWIGGMVFIALVLVPATRRMEHRGAAVSLVGWTGRRFRWIGWTCLCILVLSGVLNLFYRGFEWSVLGNSEICENPFARVLGVKLLLVVGAFLLSALHDFSIGPRATELLRRDPASPRALTLRRRASWIGRLNLLLVLVIVALGVALARGGF